MTRESTASLEVVSTLVVCTTHGAGGCPVLLWNGVYHWSGRIKVDFY